MRGTTKIILAIVGLILAAAITVVVLFFVKGNTSSDVTNQANYTKSSDIITAFNKKASQASFNESKYSVISVSTTTEQPMYVYDSELQKFISVETIYSTILNAPDGLTVEDLANANTNITDFFKENGLSDKVNSYDDTILTAQSSEHVTCQAQTITVAETVSRITISCVDASVVKDKLSEISTLVALWPSADSTKYDSINELTFSKDSQKVAILRVSTVDLSTTHDLVFVKINDNWKYIGDASTGESVQSNERFVINKDIKAGLDNKEYGATLLEALQTL